MSVKSAVRVMRIFELLTTHPDGLTIKEIARELALPQSSTFHLVVTLFEEGYLQQDAGKRYRLGAKLIQIGTAAMESVDISAQGVPYLKRLMDGVQETVFMAVLSDDQLVYIAKIDNNRSIRTTAQPGSRKPLYCTGLGKAFLAFMPENERRKLFDRIEFVRFTKNTMTSREQLEEQLKQFTELGYAIDDEENEEGLFCLAAPVYGSDGVIKAAISTAGPKDRMLKRKDVIAGQLLETAGKITEAIGGYVQPPRIKGGF
ncbi:IclR family transcriptional regulator [Bacillus glycinifermentans]|uniref:Glycerol operon regulatory protein n=1 Tax=Bacillus glycinifermentans TaxID=1664069 RepID=A0A0J6EPR7_9BACI|nr:IclR family transcriptional regulator [Bacillus glycinifermentans]ATH93686.1 IclR family transcriptional regulator [Bacillus glycinifermentans]KMM59230.1 IclR family transcriptional regulator [Bacillus glycinifermentans]KRT90138.1 IclR family transcriptional regulator [Bacillus glycinifermentans]MEC0483824.1 IclR family transcriptional regulator [Bacillus glycinifermentans]MEC0496318.1 IclR family transcriptional regulator [Bacillus glycinifermentans]